MARAVEHALVRTVDSSGSSIELPVGTNNVIFGQSTTMHQGDVDLDSMIEESGGNNGGRDGGAIRSDNFGNGKQQQFAVANQDASTSSAGNAIVSELTLHNGGGGDPQKSFKMVVVVGEIRDFVSRKFLKSENGKQVFSG